MNVRHMRGVYVVEFAIVGIWLLVIMFGVLEFGRLYFTVNAMNEVVRRGARLAVVCDPTSALEQRKVLQRAIFNAAAEVDGAAESSLIAGLRMSSLDLSYIYVDEKGSEVEVRDPDLVLGEYRNIRFVRLRVVDFPFKLLIPIPGFDGAITLPEFQSTLPRESLGRHPEGTDIIPC